jgi:hypothetical protein
MPHMVELFIHIITQYSCLRNYHVGAGICAERTAIVKAVVRRFSNAFIDLTKLMLSRTRVRVLNHILHWQSRGTLMISRVVLLFYSNDVAVTSMDQ